MLKARKAGRPTEAETEQLNEAIVRAAFKMFTRVGYAEATMEMIAQESGTTRRSISHRFPEKSDLLIAAIELASADQRRKIFTPAAVLAGSALDAVRHACRATFDAACDPQLLAFHRLATVATVTHPMAGEVLIRLNDRFAGELESLVLRAQRNGGFSGQDPALIATALIAIFLSNPLNRHVLGDPQFQEEKRRVRYFNQMWRLTVDAFART